MMGRMKTLAFRCGVFAMSLLLSPLAVMAQDDDVMQEARQQGYAEPVTLEPGSNALMYLLFVALLALAGGVIFMNAKRTHLD